MRSSDITEGHLSTTLRVVPLPIASRQGGKSVVLHHFPALDHHVDVLELAHVGERVAVDGDEVAVPTHRDPLQFLLEHLP